MYHKSWLKPTDSGGRALVLSYMRSVYNTSEQITLALLTVSLGYLCSDSLVSVDSVTSPIQ